MKQDLPPEIIIEILSRLPVRSIIRCTCVCKSWLDLIKSNEFVNSHLSKSVPGLALFEGNFCYAKSRPKPYKFLEFVENSMHIVFSSSFPHDPHKNVHSSVNGLLLLLNPNGLPRNLDIYNPITRDYIKLPSTQVQLDTFGFGVSKKSGQYKVVRLFHECIRPRESGFFCKIDVNETKCEVYTLGTGSWRIINEPNVPLRYTCDYNTAAAAMFLNGNLHWWGRVLHDSSLCISCFDLETEVFTIFSAPPIHGYHSSISALEECLVVCDTDYYVDERMEIVIWFMNEYGDDKSWTKKFIITKTWSHRDDVFGVLRPIKVFEDGDILFSGLHSRVFCYSNKNKTIEEANLAELNGDGYDRISAASYIPSFVPINSFTMENVMHF
ncbi:hypothetical protein C2S51_014943 [Perilla frutescens var. frutescens]|nr:hypothetical protein C2S51_014943 [Perilla frutescens var. frutescens]